MLIQKIEDICIADDLSYIASCSTDGTLKKWNTFAMVPPKFSVVDFGLASPFRAKYHFGFLKMGHFFEMDHKDEKILLLPKLAKLHYYPSDINIFHLLALESQNAELVEQCIDLEVLFYPDELGNTPLHYFIAKDQNDIIDLVLRKSDKIFSDAPQEVFESFSTIYQECLRTKSENIGLFVKHWICSPDTWGGKPLPTRGSIGSNGYVFKITDSIVFTDKIRQEILRDGTTTVQAKVLRSKIDLTSSSESYLQLMESLLNANTLDIFRTKSIASLVEYCWLRNRWKTYMIYLFYLIYVVVIGIYTIADPLWGNQGLEITIFMMNSIYAVDELVKLIQAPKAYITSLYSLLDLCVVILFGSALIIRWNGATIREANTLTVVPFYTTYFAWGMMFLTFKIIAIFRIWPKVGLFVRTLKEMVGALFGFAIVVAVTLIGFGRTFNVFDSFNYNIAYQWVSFLNLFGGLSDYGFQWNGILTLFGFEGVIVNILMLNIAIAIATDTYDRVQENHIPMNCLEQLDHIVTNIRSYHTCKRIARFLFGCHCSRANSKKIYPKEASKAGKNIGYLMMVTEATLEEQEGEGNGYFSGRVKALKKTLKVGLNSMKDVQAEQYKNLQKRMDRLEDKNSRIDEKLNILLASINQRNST